MTTETTAPTGIPQIPAGAQLGGEGTAENQQQAQQVQQPQSPITANTQQPQNPLQPTLQPDPQAPVHQEPPQQPLQNEQLFVNPYAQKPDAVKDGGTYIETSIQHLTSELGVNEDVFDAVIDNALKHGDLSLINPHALGKQLTPEQAQRVQQLATAAVQEVQQGVERAKTEVYGIAGGEANWNTAVTAFNANAPEDAQGYASYLADQGKLKQAAEYVLKYNQQGGYTNHQGQAPLQGGVGSVQSGLSKSEYVAELSKIELEAGNRSLGSPEFSGRIADLDARRNLGRQQGR